MKIACCITMMMIMLLYPDKTTSAASNSLRVWGYDVVPSLFPYMVFSRMLTMQLSHTPIPVRGAITVLGLSGGSPSGSAAMNSINYPERLNKRTVYTLCTLTGTISPMFILNTVNTWFGNNGNGAILLLSHYLSAFFSAILIYSISPAHTLYYTDSVRKQEAADPITSSVHAVLGVGGCIVFYSVLAEGIQCILPFMPLRLSICIHAALEVSGGIKALADSGFSYFTKTLLCSFFLGFSGLSILSQNLFFLKPFKIRLFHLISFGCIRGILSLGITAFLLYMC